MTIKRRKTRSTDREDKPAAARKTYVPTSITVTVQKTIQAKQFEPVIVGISQTYNLEEGDNPAAVRADLYNQCSKTVAKMMDHELAKWQEE